MKHNYRCMHDDRCITDSSEPVCAARVHTNDGMTVVTQTWHVGVQKLIQVCFQPQLWLAASL